jgi:hypothetical protein
MVSPSMNSGQALSNHTSSASFFIAFLEDIVAFCVIDKFSAMLLPAADLWRDFPGNELV